MALALKSYQAEIGSTATVIYDGSANLGAGEKAVVYGGRIANKDAANSDTVDVYMEDGSELYYFLKGVTIKPSVALEMPVPKGVELNNAQDIVAISTTGARLHMTIAVIETDEV